MRSLFNRIFKHIKENKADILCVSLIFILGIVLRVITINNYGCLTQDEPYSWRFASYNSIFETIKQTISVDVHMPLYFILLNIWIKLFGDSFESLHLSSLFMFLPTIPLTFYITKKLFNKTAAYFAIIILTFNTFCIYYSVFVRFYALLIPMCILFSYLFVKMLEKFEKKYVIFFILFHCLMFYTFTLNLILLFFTAIVGLHYVIVCKKDIKKYINVYLLIFALSIPGIIIFISNLIATSNNICSHQIEFFMFDPRAVLDIVENFFSNENFQLVFGGWSQYRSFIPLLSNAPYFFLIAIPIFFGVFFLIKSLFSKNNNLYLFLLPSIFTIFLTLFLSKYNIMYFQTKYLIIVFPMVIIAVAYGFTLFKAKYLSIILFTLYMCINLSYTASSSRSILKYGNYDISYMNTAFYYNKIKDTDYVISPFVPEVMRYFFKIGNVVPFALDEGLLIKDKKSLEFYFGKNELPKINKDNVMEYIKEYIDKDIPMPAYENNIYQDVISKMKKGQKLVILSAYDVTTGYCENYDIFNPSNPLNKRKFPLIMKKCMRDTILIADKYLKKVNLYRNYQQGYTIYVYEKE